MSTRYPGRPRCLTALAVVAIVLHGSSRIAPPSFAAGRQPDARPSTEETKRIAEEGYIYGLPLVMNYAITYDLAVNRASSQFKAPFNTISNEARVFTPDDTA